jgi:tetrahydromethanopterin S-methyltransferase subunit G
MKNLIASIIAFLFILTATVIRAQEEPIEISPFIGNKLDRVERDFFMVLPAIEGFEEAQFYLNPDGSLKAVIKLNKNGIESDTILERYSSLERLETLIVSNVIKNIPDNEEKIISIRFKNGELKDQKIFSANNESIFTLDKNILGKKNIPFKYGIIKESKFEHINSVVIPRYNFKDYLILSSAIGGGAGLVGGFAYGITKAEEKNTTNENLKGAEAAVDLGATLYYSAIGAAIGIGVGLLAGIVIGAIFGEDDKFIDPKTPSGLSEIEPYIFFKHGNEKVNGASK